MHLDLRDALSKALVGRYEIERELGRGGMGVVFLARDLRQNRVVAIKVLRPEFGLAPDRFLREIRIAAGLQHPNVVPLLDSGEAEGLPYYVMPMLDGPSLRVRMRQETRLAADEVVKIVSDVAEALTHAHEHSIVHRDVKPENIILTGRRAVLLDFGVARAVAAADSGRVSSSGIVLGTPRYMSPEQWSSEAPVDGRTDTYALACVTYEMLAGEPPFDGPDVMSIRAKHVGERPPTITVVRQDIPIAVQQVLEKALAKIPANRFATSLAYSEALQHAIAGNTTGSQPVEATDSKRHWRRAVVAAALVVVVAVAGFLIKGPRQPPHEPALLAVAPFDVRIPELAYWGEGLADLVARNLDGSGVLRCLPPSVVLRMLKGRADLASATELGKHTGAGLAVLGVVLPSGRDSVRLSAQVIELGTGRNLADVQVREHRDRIDLAADSLSFQLLVALSPTRAIGGGRLSSIGSSSLPAMKAFLQGEHYYRRTAWDSAVGYYRQAVDHDSTFALALLRLSLVTGWQRAGWTVDQIQRDYALEAGRRNRGLATRDSLVVVAESLHAAVEDRWGDTLFLEHRRRLFAVLEEATQRYDGDPELWYALGRARLLVPRGDSEGSAEKVVEAFDRAIRLDSSFAPAYLFPVEQAMLVSGPAGAQRYLSAYLKLNPTDVHAEGMRLASQLLDPSRDAAAAAGKRMLQAPAEVLYNALEAIAWWVDSAETAVKLARLAHGRLSASPLFADIVQRKLQLASTLGYRGHIQEAFGVLGGRALHRGLWAVFLTLGALPQDTASQLLRQLSVEPLWPPNGAIFAVPWWAAQGDLASLRVVARRADSLARSTAHRLAGPYARFLATSANAHLLSATGQPDAMFRALSQWDESVCAGWDCYYTRLDRARLMAAHGRPAEAAALLDAETPKLYYPMAVLWRFERARLAAEAGRQEQARKDYQYVVDAWTKADPQLRRWVVEARKALDDLKKAR